MVVHRRSTQIRSRTFHFTSGSRFAERACSKDKWSLFIFQTSEDRTIRDLSRLTRKIQKNNKKVIAREQLEIGDVDIDNIAADCSDKTYEFNYEILNKW